MCTDKVVRFERDPAKYFQRFADQDLLLVLQMESGVIVGRSRNGSHR